MSEKPISELRRRTLEALRKFSETTRRNYICHVATFATPQSFA